MLRPFFAFVQVLAAFSLAGCGLTVPQISPPGDGPESNALLVQSVSTHVHCELRNAVFYAYNNLKSQQNIEWLRDWAAKITLTINVDEKSGFNPGVSLTKFFPSFSKTLSNGEVITGGRTFDLGFGASLSSTASREQEITWFVVFKDLFEEEKFSNSVCDRRTPFPIEGDLAIKESVLAGVFPSSLVRNMSDPFASGGRLQVVQHQVSFLVESSGNVTPSWKLVDIAANTGGPFFGVSRNRKDILLITMGPTQLADAGRKLKTSRVVPSDAVNNAHYSKQTGNNVGNSILNLR